MSVFHFSVAGGLLMLAGLVHAQTEYKAPAASQKVDLRRFSQVESAPISRGLGADQANTTPSVI